MKSSINGKKTPQQESTLTFGSSFWLSGCSSSREKYKAVVVMASEPTAAMHGEILLHDAVNTTWSRGLRSFSLLSPAVMSAVSSSSEGCCSSSSEMFTLAGMVWWSAFVLARYVSKYTMSKHQANLFAQTDKKLGTTVTLPTCSRRIFSPANSN